MKIKNLLIGIGLVVSGMLASCSMEMDDLGVKTNSLLYKAPEMKAYVNETRSANTNNNEWQNVPENITDFEKEYVANWFAEHPGFSEEAWDFTDFYVQHVSNTETKQGIWHRFDQNRVNNGYDSNYWDEEFSENVTMDKLQCGVTENSLEDVNNFNAANGSIMLMENSSAKQWGYHSTWGTENDGYFRYFQAAIIDVPGIGPGYYIGFSYYAKKYDNGDKELGTQRFDYCDDWIVKITPADPELRNPEVTNPETPDDPTEDSELCEQCGHEHLAGTVCQECTFGTACNYGENHKDEVEVNLGIDTKGETSGGKYNESHLSIHIRSAVDVDIFIPMPLEYVCPADDMAIVKKHLEDQMGHGGEFTNPAYDENGKVIMEGGLISKMEYNVGNWTVTLYVEYTMNPEEGIRIYTEGIAGNTELIEYLFDNYGDGLTFEIWNYYADDTTLEQLKEYLDQATIDFVGGNPEYYINAFGEENYQEGKDCNVKLKNENLFDWVDETWHLNGSEHNKIWKKINKLIPEVPVY